jgi:hypothetical protein
MIEMRSRKPKIGIEGEKKVDFGLKKFWLSVSRVWVGIRDIEGLALLHPTVRMQRHCRV